MPCRDPRDDITVSTLEECRDDYRKEISEYKDKIDALTSMACAAFTAIENGDFDVLNTNKEVKLWWEEHKKLDEERIAKEKEDKAEALKAIEAALSDIERYQKQVDSNLGDEEVMSFFNDRIDWRQREIREHLQRFPELAKSIVEHE